MASVPSGPGLLVVSWPPGVPALCLGTLTVGRLCLLPTVPQCAWAVQCGASNGAPGSCAGDRL